MKKNENKKNHTENEDAEGLELNENEEEQENNEIEEKRQPYEYEKRHARKIKTKDDEKIGMPTIALLVAATLLVLFNQFQINSVNGMLSAGVSVSGGQSPDSYNGAAGVVKDLSNVNTDNLKSTADTLAAVFPLDSIKTQDDAMAILFPTGTPEYGAELGVSYDDPVASLGKLAKMYRPLKDEVQKNNPERWKRFMALASKPLGISCEYCCGIGTIGIDKNGNSACGCQHNPALLSIALYLTAYTDYSDAQILQEVMRWKTLFFPQKMIDLGMKIAGGDVPASGKLPEMVGGC